MKRPSDSWKKLGMDLADLFDIYGGRKFVKGTVYSVMVNGDHVNRLRAIRRAALRRSKPSAKGAGRG